MEKALAKRLKKFNRAYKRRKFWNKVITLLSAIVVFCTTYILILPAITLDKNNYTNDSPLMTLALGDYGSEAITPNTRFSNP